MSSPQDTSDIGDYILFIIIPISLIALIRCCISCKKIYKKLTDNQHETNEENEGHEGNEENYRVPEVIISSSVSNKKSERENNIEEPETDDDLPSYSEVFLKV